MEPAKPVTITVLREQTAAERRVAMTPETAKKFIALGARVMVEAGAGLNAAIGDADFQSVGALVTARQVALGAADIVLAVQGPAPASLQGIRPGTCLIGNLAPLTHRRQVEAYADLGVEALAMELMPRITRAQSMDTLSSQSNLSGYRAVLDAAHAFGRAFPMMMTAAGTISAARVFVMGVGVAGLQAIATARRLGAQVSATDVRSATREQILSLGAKPIFVQTAVGVEGEGRGGYASEVSEEYQRAQAELVSAHISKQDIVITTALIPGRPAPRLVNTAQIARMKRGSVIVDLAIEQGGNVEGAVEGEVVERHGVSIIAHRNVPSRIATDAAALFSRNLYNFLFAFWNKEAGRPVFPQEDEIVKAVRLTSQGKIVNERLLTQPADA